jgi:acyl-CoA thioester hydrolase
MVSADVTIKVQFYDLDPMGVVWHGNYARFFEQARCALLDEIGYNYQEMKASGYLWPIVDLRIKYVRAVHYAHQITVTATLVEYENRLKIAYVIRDNQGHQVLTKAQSIQVAVQAATGELCLESPAVLIGHVRSRI